MRYLFGIYLIFSIFFSSFVFLAYQNANHILFQSKELSLLSFTFQNATTEENAQKISSSLKNKYKLKDAKLHSPADQYNDFLESFAMYNQGAFDPEEILQLIPFVVDFVVNANQDVDKIRSEILSERIFLENGTSSEWMDKLKAVAALTENVGRFLFLFLFASTSLMTVATIRIVIAEDDFKNKMRSYLGESFQEIYKRYLWSTARLYAVAITLGFLMTYLIYYFLIFKIRSNFKFSFIAERLHFLTVDSVLLMLVGFFAAFGIGSSVALKKLFHRIYDEE